MPRTDRYSNNFFLLNVNDEHMRFISRSEGEAICESGQASRVYKEREHGKANQSAQDRIIGYKLRVAVRPPDPGQPAINKGEMLANAGVHGRSQTARLHERDKLTHTRTVRYHSGVEVQVAETEDFVERGQAKVAIWSLTGDTKAVRVGPRPDLAAINFAIALERQGRLYPNPEG